MIHPEIQNALNQQINQDFQAWYFYRAGADYCDETNLRGIARWLRERADKKLDQATKVSGFILECRGHVTHTLIAPPQEGWNSPLELLEDAAAREQHLGESVGAIMSLALTHGDHSAHQFLEPFARQQAEAESQLVRVAERLRFVGDAPAGLFLFDEALA